MRHLVIVIACVLFGGCGSVNPNGDDDAAIDGPGSNTHTIGGNVTGVDGTGVTLQLNGGDDITVTVDGSFLFTSHLDEGASYEVTVAGQPACPAKVCTVTAGSGTIGTANVNDVDVRCNEPLYRLGSQSWGDGNVRVTDDLLGYADGATATPRVITGASNSPTSDTVALDTGNDQLYVVSNTVGQIKVFSPLSTATGAVAPSRTITINGETNNLESIEYDSSNDRIYTTSASGNLYILDNANSLNGAVSASTTVAVTNPATVTLDRTHDRLFVGGNYDGKIYIFDNASGLTAGTAPTHTVTLNVSFFGATTLAVDECTDRLYLGSNDSSPAGYSMLVFANGGSLDGAVNLDTDSVAQVGTGQCISGQVDAAGRLYCWPDSPSQVQIYDGISGWTGVVNPTPLKVIHGVVASGYGLDVQPY
jgi:hypothetical protein